MKKQKKAKFKSVLGYAESVLREAANDNIKEYLLLPEPANDNALDLMIDARINHEKNKPDN